LCGYITSTADFVCFSVTVETRLALFDKLFADKLRAVERCYAFERMKIPSEIGNSKLVAETSVSIF
jgi:hypothetical protein